MSIVVAVDTGGTFTDVVVWDGESLRVLKLPSTPERPDRAVLDGVARVLAGALPAAPPFALVHGSTVATNALLERRGARVALVTNEGFQDVIELGRQNRPQLYALTGERPPPLVEREHRHGVRGRMGPGGEEVEALNEEDLHGLAARVGDAESIAVCLLHSYANSSHEMRVADALASLGVPVSVSSRILPEFREYERTATTVVNAYVAPLMDQYLGRIESESGARHVRIMGSGGGAFAVARARREGVHTVLSGPAGGVAGALEYARRAGIENVLTFDMGGTSTDVSLCPGRPLHTREFTIAGLPVAVPVLDIHTVGAGGGSIARVDAAGALRVGPESAGAVPGPICYGRGGKAVTVTDANVWLGRLPSRAWAHTRPGSGGSTGLDRQAIDEPLAALAKAIGSDREAAAEGVVAVVNAAMERALRVISVERGHDPSAFTLIPFGGAAGLHVVALAERLRIPAILVPPDPGVLSAWGMLVAPVRKEVSRTVLWHERDADRLAPAFADLEAEAVSAMMEEGVPASAMTIERRIDARYRGQSFELTVPAQNWTRAFHDAHRTRYGYEQLEAEIEAVTIRVEALAPGSAIEAVRLPRASPDAAPASQTTVTFQGQPIHAVCWERNRLGAGAAIAGPAIVLEYSSTLWIPPGWAGHVREDACLMVAAA